MTTRTELIKQLSYVSVQDQVARDVLIEAADMLKADGKEQRKPEWRRGFEAGLAANEKIAKDATNALRSEQQAHLETNRLMTQAITDSEATNDKLREAARLALDALEHVQWKNWRTDKAITALTEALK
jgi:hypothetical protein